MTNIGEVHFPNVEEFASLPEDVGLMALTGALMNLGAAFEPVYFRLYNAAKKNDAADAAREFYADSMTLGRRQELTGKTVRPTLDADGLAAWDGIWERLRIATGRKGQRNFVGHTAVRKRLGLFDRAIFDPAIFDTESLAAEQAKPQASLRGDVPRVEGFAATLSSYRTLMGVYEDLAAFTARYERGELWRRDL